MVISNCFDNDVILSKMIGLVFVFVDRVCCFLVVLISRSNL